MYNWKIEKELWAPDAFPFIAVYSNVFKTGSVVHVDYDIRGEHFLVKQLTIFQDVEGRDIDICQNCTSFNDYYYIYVVDKEMYLKCVP